MIENIIEISNKDFCINFGELELCSSCSGCSLNCKFYESIRSRLSEIEELITYNNK